MGASGRASSWLLTRSAADCTAVLPRVGRGGEAVVGSHHELRAAGVEALERRDVVAAPLELRQNVAVVMRFAVELDTVGDAKARRLHRLLRVESTLEEIPQDLQLALRLH